MPQPDNAPLSLKNSKITLTPEGQLVKHEEVRGKRLFSIPMDDIQSIQLVPTRNGMGLFLGLLSLGLAIGAKVGIGNPWLGWTITLVLALLALLFLAGIFGYAFELSTQQGFLRLETTDPKQDLLAFKTVLESRYPHLLEGKAQLREAFAQNKQAAMEALLGPMHETVGHALVPFLAGGLVHMYYFPQQDGSTAMVTQELFDPLLESSDLPRQALEWIAFTRHTPEGETGTVGEALSAFQKVERRMCGTFTDLARHACRSRIRPGETAEIPMDSGDSKYLIFDHYADLNIEGKTCTLMLVLEIHPGELALKRKHGGQKLLEQLKEKGYYPFSDLDREPLTELGLS